MSILYNKHEISYLFDKNEITSLIICYYTCGIEIRQRVLTNNNFKVYVYREKGNKHHSIIIKI